MYYGASGSSDVNMQHAFAYITTALAKSTRNPVSCCCKLHIEQLLTMSSLRREEYVHEELLEERLRILLERLTWSYVVLWTLNPQTRMFEWKRGYFNQALVGTKEETTSSTSSPMVWDAQLFYTTYKSCSFAPGSGAVGRANLEGKHIWLTGDTVRQNVVSLDQAQCLKRTNIQTMMCIPWVDSVLEIGTTKLVQKNFPLMDRIQQVLSNDLLEPDPFEHASRTSGPAAASGVSTMFEAQRLHQDSLHSEHSTSLALQQPSSNQRSGFLSDQVWRSGNSVPNLSLSSDILMPGSVIQPNSPIDRVKESLSITLETGASTSLQMPIGSTSTPPNWRSESNNNPDTKQAVNQSHGAMVSSQADQWSGAPAASSSLSSQKDTPAGPSPFPDQVQQQIHATSSPNSRFSAQDRIRDPNQIRRTTSCGDRHEVHKGLSLFEAQEMQEQWGQQAQGQLNLASEQTVSTDATVARTSLCSSPHGNCLSPSRGGAQCNESTKFPGGQNNLQFQVWPHDGTGSPDATLQIQSCKEKPSNRPTVKRSSNASIMNQVSKVAGPLLRMQSLSALDVLKEVDSLYQKKAREDTFKVTYDLKAHQICKEPEPSHDVQIDTGPNLWDCRRGLELVGPVHAGHDEAAVNHMLAERRRRVKQKENFTTLRKLVPIISKTDKASTLVDAIAYLKHLQNQIQEEKANKEDIDKQCQSLENKFKKLEERNQALVEIISKNTPSSLVHLKRNAGQLTGVNEESVGGRSQLKWGMELQKQKCERKQCVEDVESRWLKN